MAAEKATAPEGEAVAPEAAEVTIPDEGEFADVDVTPTKVIMQIALTGTRDGARWPRVGGEVELPADEAERFVKLGYARLPD